ncbi:MAG: GGDEF domain-containing protein [Myxococcales bacterium]|nr:GGDEF domain-containing protein [Myxococcales bacterium]
MVEALSQSQDVFHIEHREGLADALEALEQSYFDVVLLSVSCLSSSVEGGLLRIVSLRPQASVVLICDEYQQETAFAGVRAGAHDYLVRGNDESDVILRTVRSALQRHSSATRLHYMAHHDSLTGLANRSLFEKCLRDAMDRPDPGPGVVYLDLDGFKPINDTHGHDAGDEVLRVVARRLRNVVRGLDVVARIGGDEFAVMVEGMRSIDEGAEIAERLLRRVSAPIAFGDLELTVGCSAGVALACPEVSNPE